MELSPYDKLKELSKRDREAFEKYEKECHIFVMELRERLIKYLDCPQGKIIWHTYQKKDVNKADGIIELSLGGKMILKNNGNYRFLFAVCLDDNAPITLRGEIKRLDKNFILKIAGTSRKIPINQPSEIDAVVETLVFSMEEFLKTRFTNFINETSSDFGFSVDS